MGIIVSWPLDFPLLDESARVVAYWDGGRSGYHDFLALGLFPREGGLGRRFLAFGLDLLLSVLSSGKVVLRFFVVSWPVISFRMEGATARVVVYWPLGWVHGGY